jgi:hypothetical protein
MMNAAWVYGPDGIARRPEVTTTPVTAYANAISALCAEGPDGWPGHPSDVRHARDIIHVIARAEEALA